MVPRILQRSNSAEVAFEAVESKHRVRWTDKEQKQLSDAIVNRILRNPFLTSRKAIDLAQKDLVTRGFWKPDRCRENLNPSNIPSIRDRVKARFEQIRQAEAKVAHADELIKSDRDREKLRCEILDSVTEEELEVFFREKVFDITPAAMLVEFYDPADLLATLPASAVAGAAASRIVQLMETKPSRTLPLLNNVNGSTPKPPRQLVTIAGVGEKRMPEVVAALRDLCDVERVNLHPLRSSCVSEKTDFLILWRGQLHKAEKTLIRKIAREKNIHSSHIVEATGSLDDILRHAQALVTK